jgi:hypothetical protein
MARPVMSSPNGFGSTDHTGRPTTTLSGLQGIATEVQIQKRSVVHRVTAITIGYPDEAGREQVAVIELGTDIVRTTRAIVETRPGKRIEPRADDARKSNR